MKDTGRRLAILFHDAGFIKQTAWDNYVKSLKSTEGGKALIDILKSDVSLKTFKDLFSLEIKLPFGGSEEKHEEDVKEIEKILGQPLQLTQQDILYIMMESNVDIKTIINILLKEKLTSKDTVAPFLQEEKTSRKDYQMFIERNIINPDIISKIVQKASNVYSEENRINLALDILVYNKLISQSQLADAIQTVKTTKTTIPDVLEIKAKLTAEKILEAVNQGLYFPSVELDKIGFDEKIIRLFPETFILNHLFIPYEKKDKTLSIIISDPLNLTLIDTISLLTGLFVFPCFAPQSSILDGINNILKGARTEKVIAEAPPPPPPTIEQPAEIPQKKSRKKSTVAATAAAEPPSAPITIPAKQETVPIIKQPISERQMKIEGIEALVDSKSTVQIVSAIIEGAISTRSTDIHLEPQEKALRVRFRIDGNLHKTMNIPLELHLPIISRIKVLSNMDVTERRRPQDGQFSLNVKNNNFDFRVSSLPTYYGEKLVLRILDETAVIKGLSDLGLNEEQQKILNNIIEKPYGMILVTGPTGSGKTTTLYSAMNMLNDMKRNIVTIEDPIEYKLEGINQVQVDNNIDLTFASGLRSILRQDPDVIMVGEIRDVETAKIAIRAALTGHLVFSTLHTNTSVSAISALAHMEIQRFMIASALLCVIAQRLVRKICPKCITSFKPDKGLKKDLGIDAKSQKLMYRGTGCESCFNTGYSGRIGLYEILTIDDEIRQFIIDGISEMEIEQHAVSNNKITTLSQVGINAILEKITTPEEVMEQVFLI